MKKILVLTDSRGFLAGSKNSDQRMVDVNSIKDELVKRNFQVEILDIHKVLFPTKYKGWYVIYPSSEDPGLFYKSYIEDVLLGLQSDGAILLPSFYMFRAHHNKMFMEIWRRSLPMEFNTITTVCFYDVLDFLNKENQLNNYPIILKTSEGSSSAGVYMAGNIDEAKKIIKKMSRIVYFSAIWSPRRQFKDIIKKLLALIGLKEYGMRETPAREKMIAQTFVKSLKWDYKVLVFAEKYYVLRRKVRDNDFRASGSGKFEFPYLIDNEIKAVLEYASSLFLALNVPLLSADIAFDGCVCHLIEFQCLCFGPYTLQASDHYYVKKRDKWLVIDGRSILETEMVNAYVNYIR